MIGEGGSGGALAIGVADRDADARVLDLLGDLARGLRVDPVARRRPGQEAAAQLKLTARSASELGVIDEIVPEPSGGAHRDHRPGGAAAGRCDRRGAARWRRSRPALERRARRRAKFRQMGVWLEPALDDRRRRRSRCWPTPPVDLDPASPRPIRPRPDHVTSRAGRRPRRARSRRPAGSSRGPSARAPAPARAPDRSAASAASSRRTG